MRLRSQVVVVAIARYLFTFMRWDRTRSLTGALSSTLSLSLCVYRSSQLVSSMTLSQQAGFCLRCSIPENLFVMHKHTLSFCTRSLSAATAAQRSVVAEAAAAATAAYWFVLCLNFFQFFCCVQSRRRSAVSPPLKRVEFSTFHSLCVCVCTCACAVAKFN